MEIKITNPSQFAKLVEELEKNPPLARGFRRGTTPSNFKEQWENVATVLNSLGPPTRNGDGWQKIWRDLKFKVKKKISTNRAESKATGGGVFKQTQLRPLEEAVANLLQFEKQLNPEGAVQGGTNTEESLNFYLLDCLEMESSPTTSSNAAEPFSSMPSAPSSSIVSSTPTVLAASTASAPSTSAVSTKKQTSSKKGIASTPKKSELPTKGKNELLKRHSMDQARILTEISNSITSLKRNLRDMKDIEAKRLKIETERSKREEEMHLTDMKIKRIELKIE